MNGEIMTRLDLIAKFQTGAVTWPEQLVDIGTNTPIHPDDHWVWKWRRVNPPEFQMINIETGEKIVREDVFEAVTGEPDIMGEFSAHVRRFLQIMASKEMTETEQLHFVKAQECLLVAIAHLNEVVNAKPPAEPGLTVDSLRQPNQVPVQQCTDTGSPAPA